MAIQESSTSNDAAARLSKPKASRGRRLREYGTLVLLLGVLTALGLCRIEILWTPGGPMLLKKERFTLAESFVSLSWINDAGTIEAAKEWPMTFAALQREGIVRLRPEKAVVRHPVGDKRALAVATEAPPK